MTSSRRIRRQVLGAVLARVLGPAQRNRRTQLEELPPHPGEIVFLGDSITEQGLWNEWFPGRPVRNRGLLGDTAAGVLARLDTTHRDPAAVFLMIGTNNLTIDPDPAPVADTVATILRALRQGAPNASVFLQSVLPRKPRHAQRVRDLNRLYEKLAAEHGATWVDLWTAFADSAGVIRPEHSADALHLTGAGYRTWVEIIAPHVAAVRTEGVDS